MAASSSLTHVLRRLPPAKALPLPLGPGKPTVLPVAAASELCCAGWGTAQEAGEIRKVMGSKWPRGQLKTQTVEHQRGPWQRIGSGRRRCEKEGGMEGKR